MRELLGFTRCLFFVSQGKHAKCKQYVGHSAHVTNVRFSHDDRKLVSVGGADTSVMVWAHNAGSREPASETSQSADPMVASSGFSSEDSDTDSEEEGGALKLHNDDILLVLIIQVANSQCTL